MISTDKNPWQEAEDFGIDTSLIRMNLDLSYEERAIQHQKSLDLILELRKAKARYDESRRVDPNLSFLEHPESLKTLKNLYLQTDLGVLDILGFVGGYKKPKS